MPTMSPDVFIQIVRFRVTRGRAEPLMQAIFEHLDDWVRRCDGFVSSNFHVSDDGHHVINYAQWRDKAAFEAFRQHPRQFELQGAIAAQAPEQAEADNFALTRSVTT
ncbi:antibiotic biosynthesis monooxygenase [uncultured Tateyamaria sp.]|uniref:antibiotic biosynthesis monooxygenase family protein n=1 Tax=uncultured Tateyamaria sp. TaxID=455651 RepID=UPI0026389FC2|nr:antibiotic biosynthesis monooxygenase family protein [uncultured Tateyamaria sp.]